MTPEQALQVLTQLVEQTPALPRVVDQMREALAVLQTTVNSHDHSRPGP